MAFDAEAAWADLAEVVADREGWGRDRLLAEMRKLETKYRLPEGHFARFVRLYGDRLTLVASTAEADPAGERRAGPGAAKESRRTTEDPEEDRDGNRRAERQPVPV